MLSRSPQTRTVAMLLGLWAVAVGAWTIYRGFAKTPVPTVKAQLRTITRRIQAPAKAAPSDAPLVIPAAKDGIVSIVSTLEGSTVARGDVLLEFDRSAQEQGVIAALQDYSRAVVASSDSTTSARGALDELQTLNAQVPAVQRVHQQALGRVRSIAAEYGESLASVNGSIEDLQKVLKRTNSSDNAQNLSKEVEESLSLMRIAVEGTSLSDALTLSDIRTFFGQDGATTSFLKALPQPQLSVPLWEKLLDAQRLQKLVADRLKQPESQDPQFEQQLLLTSKAISESAFDILTGLKTLLGQIEPSDTFPLSEHQTSERLIERNIAAMQAALDSLQMHEQKFLSVWQQRGDSIAKERAAQEEARSKLQAAFGQRSKQLAEFDAAMAKAWGSVADARQKQSELLERQHALEAVVDVQTNRAQRVLPSTRAAAQSELTQQQRILQELTVHAPIAGVVAEVLVRVGDAVRKGEPLVRLRSVGNTLSAQVDPGIAAQIPVGSLVELSRVTQPSEVNAAVVHDSDALGMIRLSPLRMLSGGTEGETVVTIPLSTGRPVVALPEWMIPKQAPATVTVLTSDGNLQTRQIELGLKGDDGWVEVRSGLKEGDAVVGELLQ